MSVWLWLAVALGVFVVTVTIRNAPVRNDFDTTTGPPPDADTVLRRYLDDRADWPDAS